MSAAAALVVSQFTLFADTRRGRRPGFSGAAPPDLAERLYLRFAAALRELGPTVATGRFGAAMAVELVNDGPFTIWLDTTSIETGIAVTCDPFLARLGRLVRRSGHRREPMPPSD